MRQNETIVDGFSSNALENYKHEYNTKLNNFSKADLSVLSFSSLAIVTGVSKEQSGKILTDFFAAFIEISRKT